MASESSEGKTEGAKPTVNTVETKLFSFYNSMTSSIKKYADKVNLPMMKPEGEEDTTASSGSPKHSDSRTPSISNAPVHEVLEACHIEEPEIPELPSEPEYPPGVLYMMDETIAFRILTEEYVTRAVSLLCNHFFKDEPLGRAIYLESPREVDHWLSKVLPHMIRHEASVMALDESEAGNGKLIGVAINSVKLKGQPPGPDDMLTWINPKKDPKMYKIVSFLNLVTSDINFFERYNVDKLFSFELLNVDKTYGGRGIASKLVEQGINIARDRDFKCLLTETTGIFSAKIFSRHNFKVIKEVAYSTHRENGKPVFPSTGIHTTARVLVKDISKEEALKREMDVARGLMNQ